MSNCDCRDCQLRRVGRIRVAPLYVVVTTHESGPGSEDRGKSIVMETTVEGATLAKANERAAAFEQRFGPCRVGRVVFEDEPGFTP
jgi:hypothetical protein